MLCLAVPGIEPNRHMQALVSTVAAAGMQLPCLSLLGDLRQIRIGEVIPHKKPDTDRSAVHVLRSSPHREP